MGALPLSEHLELFWQKNKHEIFSPAAADETLHALKLFCKLEKNASNGGQCDPV
jgi:hypothetical protein